MSLINDNNIIYVTILQRKRIVIAHLHENRECAEVLAHTIIEATNLHRYHDLP